MSHKCLLSKFITMNFDGYNDSKINEQINGYVIVFLEFSNTFANKVVGHIMTILENHKSNCRILLKQ